MLTYASRAASFYGLFRNLLYYPKSTVNPTISSLHEPGALRFLLALDLAEIFKPLIVDKMLFKLINKQMVTEGDLMEEVGFAHLKEGARKVVVQEFDERLRTTVKHRQLGRISPIVVSSGLNATSW